MNDELDLLHGAKIIGYRTENNKFVLSITPVGSRRILSYTFEGGCFQGSDGLSILFKDEVGREIYHGEG